MILDIRAPRGWQTELLENWAPEGCREDGREDGARQRIAELEDAAAGPWDGGLGWLPNGRLGRRRPGQMEAACKRISIPRVGVVSRCIL